MDAAAIVGMGTLDRIALTRAAAGWSGRER
jgi:hypothetical protein